jgi:hypothetical protein
VPGGRGGRERGGVRFQGRPDELRDRADELAAHVPFWFEVVRSAHGDDRLYFARRPGIAAVSFELSGRRCCQHGDEMRTRRSADRSNRLRLDAMVCRVASHPADCRLDVVNGRRKLRLVDGAILD